MIVAKIILLLICTFSAVMSLVAAGITLDPDMDSSNLLPHVLAGFPLGLLLLIGVPVPTIAAYYLAGFPVIIGLYLAATLLYRAHRLSTATATDRPPTVQARHGPPQDDPVILTNKPYNTRRR